MTLMLPTWETKRTGFAQGFDLLARGPALRPRRVPPCSPGPRQRCCTPARAGSRGAGVGVGVGWYGGADARGRGGPGRAARTLTLRRGPGQDAQPGPAAAGDAAHGGGGLPRPTGPAPRPPRDPGPPPRKGIGARRGGFRGGGNKGAAHRAAALSARGRSSGSRGAASGAALREGQCGGGRTCPPGLCPGRIPARRVGRGRGAPSVTPRFQPTPGSRGGGEVGALLGSTHVPFHLARTPLCPGIRVGATVLRPLPGKDATPHPLPRGPGPGTRVRLSPASLGFPPRVPQSQASSKTLCTSSLELWVCVLFFWAFSFSLAFGSSPR